MGAGAAAGGAALAGGLASYYGAQEQAQAQKESARIANRPYRQKAPFLQDLYGEAADYADEFGGPTEAEAQGLQQQEALAQQLQESGFGADTQESAGTIRNLAMDTAQGEYLSPKSNPYLQDAINMAQRQTQQQFEEETLPSIRSEAIQSGAFGGAREGLVQTQAAQDAQQQQADIATQMLQRNYEAERQRQMEAANLAAQAQQLEQAGAQMRMAPATMLQDVGAQRAQLGQRGLQLQGQMLGVGPNRMAAPQPGPNPYAQAIQGGLGAASTGLGIYNMATRE
jgi:hypothetical protein